MRDFDFQFANADFITDYLAIGGDLDYNTEKAAHQAGELVDSAGITHVLDARQEAEEDLWDRFPEVEYRWDGIDDAAGAATAEWFERITTWAADAIDAGGTVLAHCHMGINRGPSAGFAILLRRGWDPIEALDAIRSARPIANVVFAEDALRWHLGRSGSHPQRIVAGVRRIERWRREHPLDVVRAIREQRTRGGGWVA